MALGDVWKAGGRWGAGRRVLALGAALVVAAWAAAIPFVLGDRREVVAQVSAENAFIASAFEEHARRILRSADTALRFLQQRLEGGGNMTPELQAFAVMTLQDLQAIQVAVADERGDLTYSAAPLRGPINIAEREHFQAQQRASDLGLFIARPVRSKAIGTWTFFVSRRISRPDGTFAGVVSIGLDPFYFGKVYGSLRLGQDRAGLLVGTDHFVRVRVEGDSRVVGDDISGYSPVFREAARQPTGAYEVDLAGSGVHRLASYRLMPDYPLIVVASAKEEEVLAAWRARAHLVFLAVVIFSAVVAAASWLLARARVEALRREEEARSLQAQLAQAQRLEAIGALAGGVAHDFNNMLGVILGSAEAALGEAPAAGLLRECLEEIQEAARRSAAVTRQLLTFARRVPVAPKVLDLDVQVGALLQVLRRLIGAQVELRWSPERGTWKIRIDPSQLDQVLTNLVANARDAMQGAGTLTIRTSNREVDAATAARHPGSRPGPHAVLAVSDTGSGIDPAHLSAIFEPFFTTKPKGAGTGLGLATVFGIVKQNGGFIEVESRPGHGATFRVHLPRAAEEAATAGRAAPRRTPLATPRQGSARILLVEDERAHLVLVQRMLVAAGYQVLAAEDPLEAIRLAGPEASIDLLLTDVVMPHMNGRQLFELLQPRRPDLRCLYMSGYPADALDLPGGLAEGQSYLQKPFSSEALLQRVREALEEG